VVRRAIPAAVLELLRCTNCGGHLIDGMSSQNGPGLICARCRTIVPVTNGIPRFIGTACDDSARRTQASFGYEWTHFHDWRESGDQNFRDYFQGVNLDSLANAMVLDAGCGMARHARLMAGHVRWLVAVDFSGAIDQAAVNVAGLENVTCIQADLLALPLADGRFDYIYSLGVLHHIADTERALSALVAKLRTDGHLRVYLYWKRHGWKRRLLAIVSAARTITTRMPFWLLRVCCGVLSAVLYATIVLPYRALSAIGVTAHRDLPLFVYSKYPFGILFNDQFDRFSAPIEKRYAAEEVRDLLARAGLTDIVVQPCFGWIAEGTKASIA